MNEPVDVTQTLLDLGAGEAGAWEQLFGSLYRELKRVARLQLLRLRPAQSLDTTGLVHETYIKCVDQSRLDLNDKSHFYAVAARAMRQILVDHVRRTGTAKRGGGVKPLALDEKLVAHRRDFEQILAVDDALEKLRRHSERQALVVEYRFFVGLTEQEIAELLSVTPRTVRNEWARARAWLLEAMRSANRH